VLNNTSDVNGRTVACWDKGVVRDGVVVVPWGDLALAVCKAHRIASVFVSLFGFPYVEGGS